MIFLDLQHPFQLSRKLINM